MRAVAARDRLPAAYKWLASTATWDQLVDFLALEGGPDGGFDDLVAVCQVGLTGTAKLELGKNYWDEMGQGDLAGVHTQLHADMAAAIAMPTVPREQLPVTALERAALGGLLATNRWLQPEMIGALGLLELQAGPRCRLVLQAFDRLGAPQAAYPFYVEHAEVDPVHGKDWMDKAVEPLAGRAARVGRRGWSRAPGGARRSTCRSSRRCASSWSTPRPDARPESLGCWHDAAPGGVARSAGCARCCCTGRAPSCPG